MARRGSTTAGQHPGEMGRQQGGRIWGRHQGGGGGLEWEKGEEGSRPRVKGWGAWAWALGRLPPSWPTRGQPLGCSSLGRRPRFQNSPKILEFSINSLTRLIFSLIDIRGITRTMGHCRKMMEDPSGTHTSSITSLWTNAPVYCGRTTRTRSGKEPCTNARRRSKKWLNSGPYRCGAHSR